MILVCGIVSMIFLSCRCAFAWFVVSIVFLWLRFSKPGEDYVAAVFFAFRAPEQETIPDCE